MTLRLLAAAATDRGMRRDNNEDAVAVTERPAGDGRPAYPLWVVCDGMGGHVAGEIASRLAVDTLTDSFVGAALPDPAAALESAIRAAARAVWSHAEGTIGLGGMGTTVVAATVVSDHLVVAHAGDSRAYLFRQGELRQLTDDHTWVAEQARLGRIDAEEAETHPLRHTITRALGAEDDVLPDLTRVRLQPGDRILLCSDGLTNEVAQPKIASVLAAAKYPTLASTRLVELANAAGGGDNISAIVVVVGSDYEDEDDRAGSTEPIPPVAGGSGDEGDADEWPEVVAMAPSSHRQDPPTPEHDEHDRRPLSHRLIEAVVLVLLALGVLWFLGLATARPVMAPP